MNKYYWQHKHMPFGYVYNVYETGADGQNEIICECWSTEDAQRVCAALDMLSKTAEKEQASE